MCSPHGLAIPAQQDAMSLSKFNYFNKSIIRQDLLTEFSDFSVEVLEIVARQALTLNAMKRGKVLSRVFPLTLHVILSHNNLLSRSV